jgi:hypothetical protein
MDGSKYNHYTEEEKKRKLNQWLVKKREEKLELEEKLRRVQEQNRIKVGHIIMPL